MDPVSHVLFARLLSALRAERALPRGVVAATVLGGLAPDVDSALVAVGWDVYLWWHEAGTHALAGTVVVAAGTAFMVRLGTPSTSLRPLIVGAWIGALSHVVFDLISGATIRAFWPIWPQPFSAPIVAMADPIVIAVMLVGAFALWVWPRRTRAAGALVMVLLVIVCAGKLTTRAWATQAYASHMRALGAAPSARTVEAVWGSWRQWRFFDRQVDGRVRAWVVDGWTGRVTPRFELSPTRETPYAQASLAQFDTARNFAAVHPYAFATRRHDDAGSVVFWSDARFCWSPTEQPDPQEGAPHQDMRPAIGPVRCAMWFGGSFDADGLPHEALVWLGGHLQRRTP